MRPFMQLLKLISSVILSDERGSSTVVFLTAVYIYGLRFLSVCIELIVCSLNSQEAPLASSQLFTVMIKRKLLK